MCYVGIPLLEPDNRLLGEEVHRLHFHIGELSDPLLIRTAPHIEHHVEFVFQQGVDGMLLGKAHVTNRIFLMRTLIGAGKRVQLVHRIVLPQLLNADITHVGMPNGAATLEDALHAGLEESGFFGEILPRLGERRPVFAVRRAVDELHAHLPLEISHVLAQVWLGDMQLFCSSTETEMTGENEMVDASEMAGANEMTDTSELVPIEWEEKSDTVYAVTLEEEQIAIEENENVAEDVLAETQEELSAGSIETLPAVQEKEETEVAMTGEPAITVEKEELQPIEEMIIPEEVVYIEETEIETEKIETEQVETGTSEELETVRFPEEYVTYEVAKGDTLYGICVRFYGNLHRAKEICELNHIEDMNNILYGQKILLPQ